MTATLQVRLPDGEWKDHCHILWVDPESVRVVFLPEHNQPAGPPKPFDGVTPRTSDAAGHKEPPPPGQGQ